MTKQNPYAKKIVKMLKKAGVNVVVASHNELYCYTKYEFEKAWVTITPSSQEEKVRIDVQKLYSDSPAFSMIKHLDGVIVTL